MTTHPHLEGLIQNWHVRGNDWASGFTHADDAISAINDAVIAERIRVLDRCRHELEQALAALPGGGVDELRAALQQIAALDYSRAATNGAAYQAVHIAKAALPTPTPHEADRNG